MVLPARVVGALTPDTPQRPDFAVTRQQSHSFLRSLRSKIKSPVAVSGTLSRQRERNRRSIKSVKRQLRFGSVEGIRPWGPRKPGVPSALVPGMEYGLNAVAP